MTGEDSFEDGMPIAEAIAGEHFIVDIEGFEGPIDMLLMLAREQKVDLTQISILALAEQYLAFVAHARRINLELAADYLVMAAWLAYLKSRLLLPEHEGEGEPTGEEMAEALAFQLRRLSAMQEAGEKLRGRAHLGHDFFRRGAPEAFASVFKTILDCNLYDLLKAYGDQQRRGTDPTLRITPMEAYSVEDAIERLRNMLGGFVNWESIWRFLPADLGTGIRTRSAFATTFAASLELVKEGKIRIRQSDVFAPIYLRALSGAEQAASKDESESKES